MSKLNIDTNKLKNCGTDVMDLAISYGEYIDGLFKSLENVSWAGVSSDEFVERLKLEKKQYLQLKNNLYNEGKFFKESALELENTINSIKR